MRSLTRFSVVRTPRPTTWREGCYPTPQEYRDWFLACTPEEQLVLATRSLEAGQVANRCEQADHESLLSSMWGLQNHLADAYSCEYGRHSDLALKETLSKRAYQHRVEAERLKGKLQVESIARRAHKALGWAS